MPEPKTEASMWTTVQGTCSLFWDEAVLDRGRGLHHAGVGQTRTTTPGGRNENDLGRAVSELRIAAVRAPWCLEIENPGAAGAAPRRAIYTEFGWLARWPDGLLRIGDWNESSLGTYGVANLLRPPPVLSGGAGARPLAANQRFKREDLEDLPSVAPELVVLGAEEYRMRTLPSRAVIEEWEAIVEGELALRIRCQFDRWDAPTEFRV